MVDHFNDDQINLQIEKQGFAVVPFATQGEIDQLTAFYRTLPDTITKGTYVTMFHPSYEYRKKVDNEIKQLFGARAADFLKKYRALFANFMVKEPGIEGDFPVHQDWTYVDESRYASYAFWIPMQDVDGANGALHIVPGSHKYLTQLRGPYIYEPFAKLSAGIKSDFNEPVILKAGQAVIWDHRLIHFSQPNTTMYPRLAFTLIMVPEGAEVIHCFGRDMSTHDEVDQYAIDTDFYLNYIIGKSPVGVTKIRTVTQRHIDFTPEEMHHTNIPTIDAAG